MCGIAGLFNANALIPDAGQATAVLRRMTGSMVHRGPDADGHWADARGRCFLGHRRLSIIDTSDAGRQPMSGIDGRWVISFNGEIYNFQEMRPLLEHEGVAFRGRTDTEVLLESIALWGLEALPKLDGMFAFAAFNQESGELILARDPFGEKPLYYMALPGGGLAFASELQALQCVPGFDPEVSVDAMAEVLMFQYIGAPRTIYRSVRKLPPGHWLAARAGEPLRIGRYFQFNPQGGGFDGRSVADLTDEVEDILVRSVKQRLISDVPLGAFLSGGVDSSVVCALIRRKLGVPLKTFSIGFEGASESEHEVAQRFADHLGTEHHERVLASDTADFLFGIGRLLDEPNADSSCMPTYLLSQFARTKVTVAVSGDGGDEIFGGYGRYFTTLDENRDHLRGSRYGWRAGQAYYSNRILVSTEEHVEELFGEVPPGLRDHLANLREELNQPSPPLACLLRRTDVDNYMPGAVLPKVDRMSMQHSLEVRTPFLNTELARFAEKLPEDLLYAKKRGKLLLRELAYRHLPRKLIDLPKQGFGIPMSRWGRDELLAVCRKTFEMEESVLRGALGGPAIGRFVARQRSSGGFSTYQVWALVMLESWLRHHPATIPRIKQAQARLAVGCAEEKTVTSAGPELFAWSIGPRVFAVLDDPTLRLNVPIASDEPRGARLGLIFDQLLRMLAACPEVHRELVRDPEAFVHSGIPIRIGRLRGSDSELSSEACEALRGGALFFPEARFLETMGWSEFERLRLIGVRLLVFPHPYRDDGSYVQVQVNTSTGWHATLNALRLALQGQGKGRFLRARCERGHRYLAGPFPFLPSTLEEELSHRFMLFEGLRQMPPIPVPHALVESQGRGRYSIWSRHSLFSRSEPGRGRLYPRWLTENNRVTARYLPFVPEILSPPAPEQSHFLDLLKARIAADQIEASSRPLSPGDRIVVLTHALPPGGAERQWCYLAIELKRLGFHVDFVCTESLAQSGAHYLPYLDSHQIPVHQVGHQSVVEVIAGLPRKPADFRIISAPGNPFGGKLMQLSSLLNRLRPSAVLAQLDPPNLLGGMAGLLAGVPRIVMSFRNYNPTRFPYLTNAWFQPLYATLVQSPRVRLSGNSRAGNDDYAQWIGCPKDAVALVPNAIEVDDFIHDDPDSLEVLRADLALEPDAPVILGVFRLSEEKRPLAFIEVCARVAEEVPALRVFIVGVGPFDGAMRQRIAELGLESRISLLGRRHDVPGLLATASLLLLTSSFEGMPNVVMEAQSAGVPVVASRVGGVPDCVVDGVTGFVLDPEDMRGFVSCCVQLLGDHALKARIGAAAADSMRRFFSKTALADRYLRVANSLGGAAIRDRTPSAMHAPLPAEQ